MFSPLKRMHTPTTAAGGFSNYIYSSPTQRSPLLLLNKAFNVRSNHKELLYLSQLGRKEGCPITTSEETSPTAPTE